ncbi:MAG: Rieske 2Fe-2S domain-containing protein [Candidatus Aenigmarchaeota archaeon]|nr:Rieske 2Fe-2S domain-containing protein [Candidatus Aenigmarchaeota archaeon]
MTSISIGKLSDFPKGKMKKVSVKGKEILVANLDGRLYSIDDTCTHEECSLSDGFLSGENVICHCHLAQFSLKTGKVMQKPATGDVIDDEPTYKISVKRQEVFIEV